MSESLRRSARLASKLVEESVIPPPEGYKYLKDQGLVVKYPPSYRIGVTLKKIKQGSDSILINLLDESGSDTKYTVGAKLTINQSDVVDVVKVKKEGSFYKITQNQLYLINRHFESSEEDESSEAEIPVKRPGPECPKTQSKKQKKVKLPTVYKKGVFNPNVVPTDQVPVLSDPSPDPDFSISIRLNNLNFHRAAYTKNEDLLSSLLGSRFQISCISEDWGPDCSVSSLERAILLNNQVFTKMVFQELVKPSLRKTSNTADGLSYVDTGEVCVEAYGVRTRKVNMSRGGREGNNALLQKSSHSDSLSTFVSDYFIKRLIRKGVSYDMLLFLITCYPSIENSIGMSIGEAVRTGQADLSLKLITHFNKRGGYGFNNLHELVLTNEPLPPFKKPSVTKKPIENYLVAPLHVACINPDPSHLKTLISNCDDLNYPDQEGRKAVHYAAACTSDEPLKVLKENGCNLNEFDKLKINPLMISAIYNRAETAKFLIKQGAQPHIKAKDGRAPIHFAAENGNLEVFRALLQAGAKVDLPGTDRKTPLMFAAINGHYCIVEEILKQGGKDTKKDKCKRSALIWAVKNGHSHVVSLLLSKGSPYDEPDSSKNYPVHYAAAYGWIDCLKLLMQSGADINVGNDWKIQPLLVALLQGQMGIVKHLLENTEVDVNGKDEQGRTLVSRAVDLLELNSFSQLEHLIVVKKADVNICDIHGLSPLHYLCKRPRPVCGLGYLTKEERKSWEIERIEIQLKSARLLVQYGCELNLLSQEGFPPVVYALKVKNIPLAELLINSGADLRVCASGGTVFHYLVSFEVEILKFCEKLLDDQELVDRNINEIDDEGFTSFLRFAEFYGKNLKYRRSQIQNELQRDMTLKLNRGEQDKDSDEEQEQEQKENKSGQDPAENPSGVGLFSGTNAASLLSPSPSAVFSNNTFGQVPSQGFLFSGSTPLSNLNSYLSAPTSMNTYLNPPTIDYQKLHARTERHFNEEINLFMRVLQKLIEKGANPHGTVAKLKQYREDPLTTELVKNYFTDFDGTIRLKEYGENGLRSALHLSVHAECQKMFDYLISFGLNIDHQDFSRTTVLMLCIQNNYLFANQLIDLGADLNTRNALGETVLQKAVERQDFQLIEKLISIDAELNTQVSQGRTILNIAVELKQLKLVRLLLEKGADPNFGDKEQRTSLHIAFNQAESTANASFDMESLLLLFKADITLLDSLGRTPLHYCFSKINNQFDCSHIDPIEAVSSACSLKNIKVNVQDSKGKTALHYAAQRGSITSTMFLLSKGADLELEDCLGNTPLAISIISGHDNYSVMLVQQSANVNKTVFVSKDEPLTRNSNSYSFGYNYGYNYYGSGQGHLVPGSYSMFKAAIINGWQGLAYLLIFNGYPYMLAMQDAMSQNKFMLVKTLLAKVSDNTQLQQVNDNHQNLFHTLAIFGKSADLEITTIICDQLIERGVDLHIKDNSNRNPLHYAVISKFRHLIEILLKSNVSFTEEDNCGNSALVYLVNSTNIHTCLPFLHLFVSHGANINISFVENGVKTTPLLHAIKSRALRDVIKFLLQHGASLQETDSSGQNAFIYAVINGDHSLVCALIGEGTLNLSQADNSGKTALFYAVLLNRLDIVKVILSSNKNVAGTDNEGKNVLHHTVQPFTYGSYENTEMLDLLIRLHPDPLAPDHNGNTILSLSREQMSGRMHQVIVSFFKEKGIDVQEGLNRKASFFEQKYENIDFLKDAEEYINLQRDIKNINKIIRKPDSTANFPGYYEVLEDFDLLMTKVDLSYGPYSAYVFYRMQVLVDNNRGVFVLFTRWGRIGEDGASQRTPFSDREEAVKEFCKIFKAKSGNEWGEVFEKKRGKYVPLQFDKTRVSCKDFITEFTPELHPPTEMSPHLMSAVKEFTSQKMMRSYFNNFSVDVSMLNFSNLSRESIFEAEEILFKISRVMKVFEGEQETEKKIDLINELQELTSDFYKLIPIIHDDNSAINPIITENDLKSKLDIIYLLKDLEIASKVILAALHRERVVNPYEYILSSLNVNIDLLDYDSEEYKLIKKYILNGQGSYKSLNIFSLKRRGEPEQIAKYKDEKHRKLLWHGTKSANVISILLQGLKIAPPEAPRTGYMFGKGVYFADVFSKSYSYCQSGSSSYFMFLCEVVLGKTYDKTYCEYIEALPEGYLSTKGVGASHPDPSQSIVTPYGVEVPVGPLIQNHSYHSLSYNEYIVYDVAQIRIRYLLHITQY